VKPAKPASKPAPKTLLETPHPYPGRLIAVEGIDGSGKSTQLLLLERWMRSRGYPVHFTEWNSSRLVRHSMQRGKKKNLLTPTTFSLLHAVDFADRLTYQILPPLKAGMNRARRSLRFIPHSPATCARSASGMGARRLQSRAAARFDALLPRAIDISARAAALGAGPSFKYHEAGNGCRPVRGSVESFRMFPKPGTRNLRSTDLGIEMRPIDAVPRFPISRKSCGPWSRKFLRDYDRKRANGKMASRHI